jgi:hypothetical protein
MARFKGKDTKPEIAVRKVLHAAGRRFRLHGRDLPGKPDIVLARIAPLCWSTVASGMVTRIVPLREFRRPNLTSGSKNSRTIVPETSVSGRPWKALGGG